MKTHLASAIILAAAFSTPALIPLSAANHDQNSKAIAQPAPIYAFDLRKADIEGAVLVSFTITAQGNVTDAVVVSSTHRVFEEPTLNAIKKWKFASCLKDGVAVSVPVHQLVTFTVPWRAPETTTSDLVGRLQPRLPEKLVGRLVAGNP